jgi:hypothetical protein
MIGKLINGQEAGVGTLLGEIEIEGHRQRAFAAPVVLMEQAHCLTVPNAGRDFVQSSAWIRQTMWT